MVSQLVNSKATSESLIDASAIDALACKLHGEIIESGSELYEARHQVWNTPVDRRSALIVRPVDATDVQTTVKWAVANIVPISVLSGGHGPSGAAIQNGVVTIDLGSMREISIDAERNIVRAQTGALVRDLLQTTHVYGTAVPSGNFRSPVSVASRSAAESAGSPENTG